MKKNLSHIGEFGLIERICKKVNVYEKMWTGIGDDAAILKEGKEFSLLAMDLMVEGVDFSFRSATPEEIGRKALAINLSDIAAMGSDPQAVLIGLVMPRTTTLETVDRFYKGFTKLAKKFRVSIVGGDLSHGRLWTVSVAIFGRARVKPILRSGAKPGDLICVTGTFGGSILKKHLHFEPRIKEGKFLAQMGAHSMIDVSDGLVQDLQHVLRASKVGAQLWLDRIPISRDAKQLAKGNREKALQRALTDGEDFELLCTISPAAWKQIEQGWTKRFRVPIGSIGVIKSGKPEISFYEKSREVHMKQFPKGYQHFK